MDSVTHIVLGAAIGDRLLGKKIGRKAAWIGALAKTFPDFDLLYSGLNDPRKYVLYHRSYTHSFFVELLTAFPLAYLFFLLFSKNKKLQHYNVSYKEWFVLWLVCMWSHSLVDIFTNYGTRIFLPFSSKLVSLNNIAIADLFLTVPILLLVIVALFFKNNSVARIRLMQSTLIYSILYFGMTFVNKSIVNNHFKNSIQKNNFTTNQFMSNPTILNNFLWYGIVNSDSNLYIGEYSILQKSDSIRWLSFPIQQKLLLENKSPDAKMLQWFSQGFYINQQNNDTLDVFCVKFGRGNLDKTIAKETFLFYYQIYFANGKWQFKAHQPSSKEMDFKNAFLQLIHWINKV